MSRSARGDTRTKLPPHSWVYTSARVVACCQYQRISYDTEGEVRNDNSLRLFILTTVTVVDVADHWIPSRVVQVAGRLQAAVVVDNKGRVRTGQAVHRRLLQHNFVADPDDTGVSSSTLLVHRDCPRTGGSVRRQNALQTARRVYMHRLCCLLYSTCSSSGSSSDADGGNGSSSGNPSGGGSSCSISIVGVAV